MGCNLREGLADKVLNRWYHDPATEAGVRHVTSHGTRHTAGSSYAVMGAGQKVSRLGLRPTEVSYPSSTLLLQDGAVLMGRS